MWHHVAKLAPALLVGGCSLIYNPSNIDKPAADARIIDMGEVAVDVEIRADTNAIAMELTEAFPTTLFEGVGDGGARAGVVVLRGVQFVKDVAANLSVTLDPPTAATLSSFEVAGNGDYIALALTVPVSTDCDHGATVPVKVTVTQNDGIGGMVSGVLDPGFTITCLDQLTAAPTTSAGLRELYSQIEISGPLDITAGVGNPLVLRAVSSIEIGNINVSASGREPGPGGGRGGRNVANDVQPATGPAPGGQPATANSAGGGGAGYAVAGTMPANGGAAGGVSGDVWLSTYATNRSSGGGAGAYQTLNAGTPGIGGGGGGTVELTAGGTLVVGTITANGGSGTAGDGTVGTAGDGAGGTGGTVLLRSGAMFTGGAVTVGKGAPGDGGNTNAGTSSDGRVRADLAAGTYPSNAQKGPMFTDLPLRTTVQTPPVNLRGTMGDSTATLRVFDKTDAVVANMTYTPVFGGGSPASAQVMPVLKAGYNRVCVWVAGGSDTVPESVNCQTIAYLPP